MFRRRGQVLLVSVLAALVGGVLLFGGVGWVLWRESVQAERDYASGLAARLGERTESILADARATLAGFEALAVERCSEAHLEALRQAAVSRPYLRGIGYWRANKRLCGVGFLPPEGVKPVRADRIYANGLIAWWPSKTTEVGGVQLFLMRYGDHDVAIDPRLLLDLGPLRERSAGLWVEGLRMAAVPWQAELPAPSSLALGVTIDAANERVVSRFARSEVLPLDIVAVEPLQSFWSRHTPLIVGGAVLGVVLLAAWLDVVLRASRRRLSLEAELAQAIAGGAIRVVYQPVIDFDRRRCIGAEALARWTREDGTTVSPDVFVPAAEAAGLIQDLTIAVMRTVVRDLEYLLAHFPEFSINLNLSPDDLRSERVATALGETLAAAGLAARAVKLEITERALVNSEVSRSLIRDLRQRGHQVAIDDFGTGYSSLSYLQTFELDVLKIDKSFVDAIGTEAATSQVIVHVIEMARALGLATVAEGVESFAQELWLRHHGVAYGQGYLYAKPLVLGDLFAYVRAQAA